MLMSLISGQVRKAAGEVHRPEGEPQDHPGQQGSAEVTITHDKLRSAAPSSSLHADFRDKNLTLSSVEVIHKHPFFGHTRFYVRFPAVKEGVFGRRFPRGDLVRRRW